MIIKSSIIVIDGLFIIQYYNLTRTTEIQTTDVFEFSCRRCIRIVMIIVVSAKPPDVRVDHREFHAELSQRNLRFATLMTIL